VIVSYSPGRIRLRFKELKDPAIAELASVRIREVPGIIRVEIKPLTGSLLIEFDTKALPPAELFAKGKAELEKLRIHLEMPSSFSP
jgi:hypothetical protein